MGRRSRRHNRPRPYECPHTSPVVVRAVDNGYVGQCLVCGTEGPIRETSREARAALRDDEGRNDAIS